MSLRAERHDLFEEIDLNQHCMVFYESFKELECYIVFNVRKAISILVG
jgi:hypothetical protein